MNLESNLQKEAKSSILQLGPDDQKRVELFVRHLEERIAFLESKNQRAIRDRAAVHALLMKTSEDLIRKYQTLFEYSGTAMVVIETDGTISLANSNWENLMGYNPKKMKTIGKFSDFFEEQSRGLLLDYRQKLLQGDPDAPAYCEGRIITKSGEIRDVTIRIGLFPGTGQGIVSIIDVTEQKKADALLKRFNEELEQQVTARTEELNASLDEKVILLREVHHRVKNNLQIIISLVNLQMRQTKNVEVKQIMAETQNRVRAMSLVHEKLYLSENLSRIDFADYTRFLATQLLSFYGTDMRRVRLDFAMSKIMVDINTAIPLGLVMNELISNTLKHAFPQGKEGTISIRGEDENDLIKLVILDNGIGMPAELDWKNTTSLGMRLVISLIDQIDGTIEKTTGEGTMFIITIPRNIIGGKNT